MTMSELGLAFEDVPTTKGRHRRRASSSKQRKNNNRRRGRSWLAFVLVMVLLGGLGYAGWWGYSWVRETFTTPDYTGTGTGEVLVEIKPGYTAADIAQVLYDADVVASPRAFVQAADDNPLSVNIQPGFYRLPQRLPAATAVELLLDLNNRVVEGVTVPEGLSMFRTFDLLSEELGIPGEEFEAAAEDPEALGVPEFWFNRDDDREAAVTVEGFLFPSTYEFPPDPNAEQVLSTMISQFMTVVEELEFVDTVEADLSITPYEALIAASLAQAEAGTADDLPKVARVAYNRVYQADMPLQFDVTANYWLEVQGEEPRETGQLTPEQLDDPDNPYNTVSQRGWPRGPINSPGEAALAAAMEPARGDWVYFVLIDPETGESAFAETLPEHEANIQEACANGVPLCG